MSISRTDTTEVPMNYIAKDTHTGSYTRRSRKARSHVFTVSELAATAVDQGGIIVLWEHFGESNGVALYGRTRFVAQRDGSLAGFDSDGACKIVHPADRQIRIMIRTV